MIALIQRVLEARVIVDGEDVGRIGAGLLALIGVQRHDDEASGERLAQRLVGYRVFGDDEGRMNRSVADVGGGLLLVPQFTLAADTRKGMRPGFSTAAAPDDAQRLFERFVVQVRRIHAVVATGRFGAEMCVGLVNHGPVTFWLET